MIRHFYSSYVTTDPDAQIRHMVAAKTWAVQPWQDHGIKDADLPRMFSEEGGRRFPYVRDVFRAGIEGLDDSDIAVYTNTDICVTTNCCAVIASALQQSDAVFAYRRDFHFQFIKPIPDSEIGKAVHYPGSDLYAFRAKWWREWGEEFPDLLIGFEGWDPCMRILMQETQPAGTPTEIQKVIYHQRHASFWEQPQNKNRLQAQRHNLGLEYVWLKSLGIEPGQFGIRLI